MAQKNQKHYFINLALLIVGAFVFLGAVIPMVDPGQPPNFDEEPSDAAPAITALEDDSVSSQPIYYPLPQPKAERQPASIAKPVLEKEKIEKADPLVPKFLKQKNGDYHWQPNVIAVQDLRQTKSGKYLGAFGKFSIVKGSSPSESAYPVVWSRARNQFGVYRGNVIVIGQSKDLQPYLQNKGLRFSQLSGSYIVPVETLGRAFDTVKNLKRRFPRALVEMDINMDRAH